MSKATKKATPAKKKVAKKKAITEQSYNNEELLGLILEGIDRLGIQDKTRVLAHLLGGSKLNKLYYIQQILNS